MNNADAIKTTESAMDLADQFWKSAKKKGAPTYFRVALNTANNGLSAVVQVRGESDSNLHLEIVIKEHQKPLTPIQKVEAKQIDLEETISQQQAEIKELKDTNIDPKAVEAKDKKIQDLIQENESLTKAAKAKQ